MTSYRGQIKAGLEPRVGRTLWQHLRGIAHTCKGEATFLRSVELEPEMAGSYVELSVVYSCRGARGWMRCCGGWWLSAPAG